MRKVKTQPRNAGIRGKPRRDANVAIRRASRSRTMHDRRSGSGTRRNSRDHMRRAARNYVRSHVDDRRSCPHSPSMLRACNNGNDQHKTCNHPDSAHNAPSRKPGETLARSYDLLILHLKGCVHRHIGFIPRHPSRLIHPLSCAAPLAGPPPLNRPTRPSRFSLARGCAITVGPWNVPRKQGLLLSNRRRVMVSLHQLCPSLRTRIRAQQAPVISRLRRTKTFPGIARFARSGSSPGAAS
jgi:hypothetical protein